MQTKVCEYVLDLHCSMCHDGPIKERSQPYQSTGKLPNNFLPDFPDFRPDFPVLWLIFFQIFLRCLRSEGGGQSVYPLTTFLSTANVAIWPNFLFQAMHSKKKRFYLEPFLSSQENPASFSCFQGSINLKNQTRFFIEPRFCITFCNPFWFFREPFPVLC